MDSTLRVAALFKLGGFIPEKFFKDQKSKLKKILVTPTKRGDTTDYELYDKVIPFFRQFEKELTEFGLSRPAMESVRFRIENITDIIEKIAKLHKEFYYNTNKSFLESPKGEVMWSIQSELGNAYEAKFPTLAHAIKNTWSVDPEALEAVAMRALKKATQDEIDAMWKTAHGDFSTKYLESKYGFIRRTGVGASALRLIKKDKVDWDPYRSIDFLYDVLESNFTKVNFTEFDLNGIKVIINDDTVDEDDTKKYVKYLDEAYHRLKAKGFAKVWYGQVFINCKDCGGVNYNDGGGVGGNYSIGKDVVRIFERPGPYIVQLMAHELGHRFWFKGMTSEQRARFEGLVKVYKPQDIIFVDKAELNKAHERTEDALDEVVKKSKAVADGSDGSVLFWQVKDSLTLLGKAVDDMDPKKYSPRLQSLTSKIRRSSLQVEEWVKKWYEYTGPNAKPGGLSVWLEQLFDRTRDVRLDVSNYVDAIVDMSTRKFDEEDTRSVLPVSDYGKSNADEAFAEVFSFYIMGKDLNRDQLESFKSVFTKSASERTLEDLLPEEHYVEVCRGCGTRMAQCRCSGERTTVYGTCSRCKG